VSLGQADTTAALPLSELEFLQAFEFSQTLSELPDVIPIRLRHV